MSHRQLAFKQKVREWGQPALLALILLVAATLRLTGLDWDEYRHYHPDERFLTWVATTVEAPNSLETAFDPDTSSFNPFYWPANISSTGIVVPQDQPRHFAYGHLPLYLGVTTTRLVEEVAPLLRDRLPEQWLLTRDLLNAGGQIEFRHLTAVARALTGVVDVLTVALLFFLGRRLYNALVGLLAAGFLAFNVMHIQLAHFFAVDPYLTFFTVLALFAMVVAVGRMAEERRVMPLIFLAAVAIGLAVGSKFSAVLLFLPLALTLALGWDWTYGAYWRRLLAAGLVTALVFILTNPFALLDWNCEVITPAQEIGPLTIPTFNWRSCYLLNIARQSAMVRGEGPFPFTRQYLDTTPYLYPVLMQIRWGMGPLLGLLAFAGFGWATWRGAWTAYLQRRRETRVKRTGLPFHAAEWIVLSWTVPYFLTTGGFFVKFMRYMQPLTPFLMLYGAALLLAVQQRWGRKVSVPLAGSVLFVTILYALAFVNLYSQPHPWNAASRWIFQHVPEGSFILSEQWDDPLPTSLDVDGVHRRQNEYRSAELAWLTGIGLADDQAKLRENLTLLAAGDLVTVVSNRNYGVIPRLPGLYPLSAQYHQLLFNGSLGYEPVYVTGRSPRLGVLSLWPERFEPVGLTPPALVQEYLATSTRLSPGPADESFTVYDQPLVMIFENTGRLSASEMLAQFDLEE